jgi:hypothetical protein
MSTLKIVYGVHYPKPDSEPGHHPHFIKYPIQRKDKKWVCVDVLKDGHQDPEDFLLIGKDSYNECRKACDAHNSWVGFNFNQINKIISCSMGLNSWDV